MPAYTFFCEDCNKKYEVVCSIKQYHDKLPCEFCQSNKAVHRLYIEDIQTLSASIKKSDSELKTVGDLAKRNTDRMSDDEKENLKKKHNSYKDNQPEKPLPKGMSRLNRPKVKTKWV
jgi:hypothetical protein